jgi:Fe-S cluster assembly iron-binding protein IscA
MHITPEAREKITAFMEDSGESKIRVSQLSLGGCCGAKIQLGVSLADSVEDDEEVLDADGIEVLIDPVLHKRLGQVTIDFVPESGIVVLSGSGGA